MIRPRRSRRSLAQESLVDTSADYRAFLFAIHPDHGLLLLKSREKHKKGSYWEVPGGHLDDPDYEGAIALDTEATQLQLAGRIAIGRELWEETGMDLRNDLSRFELAVLGNDDKKSSSPLAELPNLRKSRLYYFLRLSDSDFVSEDDGGVAPRGTEGSSLRVSETWQQACLWKSCYFCILAHDE